MIIYYRRVHNRRITVWRTPVGEELRDYMVKWDDACLYEKRHNNIKLLVDGQNFMFFFVLDGDVYATHEPERVTFARMKSNDDDEGELNLEDANFTAFNLSKALSAKPTREIFYSEDIPKIKVLTKEETIDKLIDQSEKVEPERIATGAKAIMNVLQQARAAKAEPAATDKPEEPGVPLNQDESVESRRAQILSLIHI